MSVEVANPRSLLQRTLCAIAGVDRETLATCPPTDKLWATHLGFSLILSFVVVFGISYHATSYVIDNAIVRFATALVIALTVFMFDRALYQSDWFSQGFLRGNDLNAENSNARSPTLWRFLRIFVRLTISFALAWIIALFLELAIFSDTITDQIARDHVKANQAVYQKIERYERGLDEDIAARRRSLAALEERNTANMTTLAPSLRNPAIATDQDDVQLRALDNQEQDIRAALRETNAEIARYSEEMNAEERGQKLKPTQSGKAGIGPRYQFAKQQRDVFLEQRNEREKELGALQNRRAEILGVRANIRADELARVSKEREALEQRQQNLQTEVATARSELQERETSRSAKIDTFMKAAFASSEFQKQKNDPLSRMTAYQQLHNDPKDGATITLFSWMTKVLVIFLEIVPVVAKIFFSPPSVYGALIQARVAREREKVRRGMQQMSQHDITDVSDAALELDRQKSKTPPPFPFEEPKQPAVATRSEPETFEQPTGRIPDTPEIWNQAEVGTSEISPLHQTTSRDLRQSNEAEPTPSRAWYELEKLSDEASEATAPRRGPLPVISNETATVEEVAPSSPAVTKPWAEALHTIINKSRSVSPGQAGQPTEDITSTRRRRESTSKSEKRANRLASRE
jgi:hypothetical protein